MSKNPWMKFYPTDWLAEPKLKTISRAARSLWFDMLCLMHQAGTGRLELDGRPMTESELAKILGDNPRTIKTLLAEIEKAGVSSRIEGGFIASRRLIQDRIKAELDVSNGRKGGNPSLKNNDLTEARVNPEVKAQKPEARSQKPEARKESPQPPMGELLDLPDPELEFRKSATKTWNAMATQESLPKMARPNPKHFASLRHRLEEYRDELGFDVEAAFVTVAARIRGSPFLTGKTTNWRCSFDWIVNKANFDKLMAGNYDDRNGKPFPARPSGNAPKGFFETVLGDDNDFG